MRKMFRTSACVMVVWTSAAGITAESGGDTYRVAETLDIDTVPSWFPVGFCLLTNARSQYVAYYDERHQMIVARRQLGDREWKKAQLPRPTITFAGIRVKIASDLGETTGADVKYVLRWETLEAHHDRPRKPPLPPASVLKLVKLERAR